MATREVTAISAKVTLDSSSLTEAEKKAKIAGDGIKAGMTNASVHTEKLSGSFGVLLQQFGHLPPIATEAVRKLDSVGSAGSAMGGALGMASVGAVAAVGAVAGIVLEATGKYVALAESVHKYMAATGESATTASAQVQAFNELGISEDVAQAAMVKLSKAIETTPKKLAAVGIEVAKDAKGNVDLNASLLNVIDAWNGTEDAAKRNEIALIAFGKNGVAAMLPILEAGSASLRQLEKDVRVTMTDADIAQAHKYVLEQKQVQASFNAVQDSIGQQVLPKLGALYDAYLKQEYVHKRMAESGVSDDMVLGQSTNDLVHKFEKEYDAAQTAKEKLNALADAHTQAGIAAAEQAKALDDLINSEEAQANASIHAQRADLAVAESAGKVDKAQDALNKTIAQYGPKSEEAQAAAFALSGTLLDQQQAYLDAATAAQTLAKDQAGPDVSAADAAAAGHQALIDKLTAEASTLAPGSALRVWLDQYIGKLHETPTDITTTFHTVGGVGGSALSAGLAGGGPALPGRTYTIGESGPETLVMG